MNIFDRSIIYTLHEVSKNSEKLTTFLIFIASNDFLKGGIVVSIFWYFWFQNDTKLNEKRERIIMSMVSCFLAIFVGRILARLLPFRSRPVLNPNFSMFFPSKSVVHGLELESSLPSDHAVMFFALATGIFFISRRTGIFTYFYISIFVCFPRIYLGLHYPSDIVLGAIIGIVVTLVYFHLKFGRILAQKALVFYGNFPGIFFLLFFWMCFQIGTMFDSVREIEHFIFSSLLHFY